MSEDNLNDVFGAEDAPAPEPETAEEKPAPKKAAAKKPVNKKAGIKRVEIILQKNSDVPPSGLFLGHNGVGYQLKPGKKANVPEFLLDILDNAVVKIPVMDDNGRVKGYEDSLRFPYQVVRSK